MERVDIGEYYFRINGRTELVEKVKETGSKQNDSDFELNNYYLTNEDALDASEY